MEREMNNIVLDYPTSSRNEPRYTSSNPNKYLKALLDTGRYKYRAVLKTFSQYFELLEKIDSEGDPGSNRPYYLNSWLPGLDCVSLYGIIAEIKPRIYMEVGSGISTKFARRAVDDFGLSTKIISIDPSPRSEVAGICDTIFPSALEDVDLSLFDTLGENDILFIDNSHRSFMNSDVTVCFMDLMPRLSRGAYLHLHDICWPLDYPKSWTERYYNEQYLLGAMLANGPTNYDILLPNYYISKEPELMEIIEPLWASNKKFSGVQKQGCGFWMVKK